MGIVDEETCGKEIKKRLKSKSTLPPMVYESREASSLKAQQTIKTEVGEFTKINGERSLILQLPQPKPLTIRPRMPTHEELKEVSREAERSRP
jgi:hypothetical protein